MPNVDLASRLEACKYKWQLRDERPLSGGFAADVFGCTTVAGQDVVLKLPATETEARAEVAALTAWDLSGAAARLIDADLGESALLLERVRPGTPLPAGDDAASAEIAAELLSRLHRVPAGGFAFPGLLPVYRLAEKQSRDDAAYERRASGDITLGEAGLARLGEARAAAERLCASARRMVLLHGDFLDKNVLWAADRYLAIDPIPCFGDPCSDVGFFAAGHPPATEILDRAADIASLMGLDPDRAERWAAVWAVLQACQSWRPDQSDLDAVMSAPEFRKRLRE
jgi:streptomycin 6-kinase